VLHRAHGTASGVLEQCGGPYPGDRQQDIVSADDCNTTCTIITETVGCFGASTRANTNISIGTIIGAFDSFVLSVTVAIDSEKERDILPRSYIFQDKADIPLPP
jgi:hypothetical protein